MSQRFSTLLHLAALLLLLSMGSGAPLFGAAESATHVPAPLNLEADLDETRLELSFLVDRYLYRHWTGFDARSLPDLDDAAYETRLASVAQFLSQHAPVAIDGIDVLPVVEDLAYLEGTPESDFLEFVAVVARYGVKGPPGTIEFHWSRYDTEDDYPLDSAFLVFSSLDDFQVFKFREDDPSQLWTRPGAPPVVDPEEVPPAVTPEGGALSILSFGVLFVCVLAAFALRRREARGFVVVGVVIIGIVVAALARPVTVVRFRLPGEAKVVLPPEETASALFQTLHRNIYRAFDYKDESAIYDSLARSLAPSLIDTVYGEVYGSMRMQLELAEEAACEIRSVRVLDAKPVLPEAPTEPWFDVVARWEVIGTVRHWGHGHWRTNRYSARYRVRWDAADGWRIGEVEILEQARLDDGREAAL